MAIRRDKNLSRSNKDRAETFRGLGTTFVIWPEIEDNFSVPPHDVKKRFEVISKRMSRFLSCAIRQHESEIPNGAGKISNDTSSSKIEEDGILCESLMYSPLISSNNKRKSWEFIGLFAIREV